MIARALAWLTTPAIPQPAPIDLDLPRTPVVRAIVPPGRWVAWQYRACCHRVCIVLCMRCGNDWDRCTCRARA